MKRKLLIDVTVLAQGIKTGIYRVTDELVKCLVRDESLEVFFTLTQEDFFTANNVDLRAELLKYGEENAISAPFIDSAIDPAFTDIDIYVSTFFKVPGSWAAEERVQKVVIAYDLIAILRPEYCEDTTINVLSEFYAQIEKGWQVLAISESTKHDLLQHRPDLEPGNITVLPLGVDDKFSVNVPQGDIKAVKEKYQIPAEAPYILSVATLEVRKNLVVALDAYTQYIERSGDDLTKLVLTGMKGWKLDHLAAEIENRPILDGRVILTGFVDEQDLPALYAGASVFVYMSFYEGFGLPPLEAMCSGVPVICSNASSLPEVVGDAGILLDPTDIDGVTDALERLLSDGHFRAGLAEQATARAALFSWERCCATFVDCVKSLELSFSPYLTIITICFNEKSIRDTCMSVAGQTYKRFEWIVVDGGSDDGTLDVLNEYRDHMACFISEKDEGRYDAMNKGILHSNGRYLLFLNGGDYLYQHDTLEKIFRYSAPFSMMSLYQLKLNAAVIYGEVSTRETGLMPHPMWKTGEQRHDMDFFAGNSLPHQATFIRKELFDRYGLYNTDLKYAADYEWFIRVLVGRQVLSQYLPAIVAVYNFEGVSSLSIDASAPHIMEIQSIYRHYSSSVGAVKVPWSKTAGQYGSEITYYRRQVLAAAVVSSGSEWQILLTWLELLLVHRKFNANPAIPLLHELRNNNKAFDILVADVQKLIRLSAETSSLIERVDCIRHLWCVLNLMQTIQPQAVEKDDEDDHAAFIDSNLKHAVAEGSVDAVITMAYWRYRGRFPSEREVRRWQACIENGVGIQEFLSRFEDSVKSRQYALRKNALLAFAKQHNVNATMSTERNRYAFVQQALRDLARQSKFDNL